METQQKNNMFVRILIVLFCLLLLGMVVYRFFAIDPKGTIDSGLILLLLLLIVLVLAESFDNFSIGKLISVSRETKKKESQINKLETQNSALLSQLINISATQNQKQTNTNVYGDYHASATVRKASDEELEESKTGEAAQEEEKESRQVLRSINWKKIEEAAIERYLTQRSIHRSNFIDEAKLVTQFHGIDPICNFQPIFDGYVREPEHETFVEFRPAKYTSMMFRDRLYLMLSKINHYKNIKQIEAHLDLVLLRVPGEESRMGSPERMLRDFEPAIVSGLLKVHEFQFTKEEAEAFREDTAR